ncbi:hypothetical protein BCR39DRAFT_523325 [Naematelia encephala]|uniref:DUF221-domain-containing protein n=1 Tax=Naematelia encephala TaxID=71784 RepID=A0A1Y2BBK6_9TREE|nr:hypothetical protein BCR39DRAFT_523325 [Naematelia encephala]
MSNTASDASSASTSSFLTSLAVNGAIAGGELIGFVLIRRWIKAIYEPRSYIPPRDQQAPPLGSSLFRPIWTIIWADPEEILAKTGVDPYVFYRFLMMMSKAMFPIWLISWIILLPVDAANSTVLGKTGLDKFTFGNVAKDKQSRYWTHLILDYCFIFWIIYLIWREMQHWLVVRQKYLISPHHSKIPQANTVLITGIPKEYLDEPKLEQLFSRLPGGVKRIWLVRNLKEMPGLWERRNKAAVKLESAEVKLVKLAREHHAQTKDKVAKLEKKGKPVPEALTGPVNPDLLKSKEHGSAETGTVANHTHLTLADQLVPRAKRPTIRLKPRWAPFGLGFLGIGEKVDAVDWARKEIAECTEGLDKSREQLLKDVNTPGMGEETYPPLNSAFIHFNQQIAAHMAAQCVAHNQPYRMNNRYIEMAPANVIWRNLSLNPYEMKVRQALSYAATVGLILLWTFPVAFIGALSNISTLTSTYSWLSWLDWLEGDSFGKSLLRGVVSGVLPPVLLALLMQLLPSVLRQLASLEGKPSKTAVELDLMNRYFIFLVIHTFFVVTLTSGLISSIKPLINNPASVATILSSQMPTASTFFITLILTQFTGTAGTLLQPVGLSLYYVRVILSGGTPRSVFRSRYRLRNNGWGSTFPGVTVYAVIMIAYCVISPIINGFGACYFLLMALIYKYLYIWVLDQRPETDTGGSFFPYAITHVFVGMYIQEVCLCALFFLARNDNGKASAIAEGALMVVLIVITAAMHYIIIQSYSPLRHSLPLSLAHLSYGMPKEDGHEEDSNHSGMEELQPVSSSQEHLNNSYPRKSSSASGASPQKQETFSPSERSTESYPTAPGPPVQVATSEHEMQPLDRNSPSRDVEANDEEDAEPYFAVHGGPGVIIRRQQDGNDPNAFFHPATKEPQRVLWLPRDELGLAEAEIEKNASFGVPSTYRFAELTHRGKLRISGPPPDDWQ